MSNVPPIALKSIRERLEKCVIDIKEVERLLLRPSKNTNERISLSKETLDRLPWKLFKSGKGSWIYRDLPNPTAQLLVRLLVANGGSTELHGITYKFSGPNNKFISRFSEYA